MKSSRSYSKRLSLKLLTTTAGLIISAILIVGMLSYYIIYQAALKDTAKTLDITSLEIETILTDIEATANTSVWTVMENLESTEREEDLLKLTENIVASDTNIVACAIGFEPYYIDPDLEYFCPTSIQADDGDIVSAVFGDESYDYHDIDWYNIPKLLGKAFWSDPSYDMGGTEKMVSSYSIPIYRDSIFIGILKADIELQWLKEKIESLKPYKNSFTYLIGRNGTFLSHRDPDAVLNKTIFTDPLDRNDASRIALAKKIAAGEKGVAPTRIDGKKGFIVYAPLKNGWKASLLCTNHDVLAKGELMNFISLLVACLALLVLYLNNRRIIDRESKAVTAISYSALSIAQGNFDAKIPEIDTKDELKRLQNSLHYLETSIKDYISELRSSTAANERFSSELNIASSIQMAMLPNEYPQLDNCDIFTTLHPAKEVGGDLYDFFVKGRRLYFCVGDVSGKGVPAALYMAITRSAYRFIAGQNIPINEVAININNSFSEGNSTGMFVTLFMGFIDLDTLEMEYCNAGHNPILIMPADGEPYYLHACPNIAAGLFADFPYKGDRIQLEKGTRLVIYTDGVTEAENFDKELYGEERMKAYAMAQGPDTSSKAFIDGLVEDIKGFTLGNPQNDDITILSIKL